MWHVRASGEQLTVYLCFKSVCPWSHAQFLGIVLSCQSKLLNPALQKYRALVAAGETFQKKVGFLVFICSFALFFSPSDDLFIGYQL